MKLIIDIPKSEYMEIKRYYDSLPEYSTVEAETYYIAHGTPFEDVKAEIAKCKTRHEMQLSERDEKGKLLISDVFCDVTKIFNNIGKAESEEKPNDRKRI